MVYEGDRCKFRSVIKLGNKEWEWCSLYNAEILKLDCETCEYLKLQNNNNSRKVIA